MAFDVFFATVFTETSLDHFARSQVNFRLRPEIAVKTKLVSLKLVSPGVGTSNNSLPLISITLAWPFSKGSMGRTRA